MKRYIPTLLIGLILILSACKPPGQSNIIKSELSGKCLSLQLSGGYYDGDPVEQWDCSHIHMGLQGSWLLEYDGQTSAYQITSIHSGKCLEVNLAAGGKNNGDIVQQAKCTGGNHQRWIFTSGTGGTATITSLHSGKCLQVRLGTTGGMGDGDPIEQWDCIGGAKNQQCIYLTSKQSVCGQSCSKTIVCPSGYTCTPITQSGQTIYQCVPNNNECPLGL